MVAERSEHPHPLVLLAGTEERSDETLERVLHAERFRVLRASGTAALFERGTALEPDAVIVEIDPPDAKTARNICRTLMQQPWMEVTTPVLVTCARPLAPDARVDLLRAGAWDILQRPVDHRELMVRLYRYLAAKREGDRARSAALIDPDTGLYNLHGLRRRCEEMAADAFRRRAALACLAIRAVTADPDAPSDAALRTIAAWLFELVRKSRASDVVGRHSALEFVVIAPRTDAQGARALGRRLWREVELEPLDQQVAAISLQFGYDSVPNVHEGQIDATTLLTRALEAARRAQPDANALSIQPFRPFEYRTSIRSE